MKKQDNYLERRGHLADLTDEQLKERFWKLTEKIIDPMLDLAYNNTTPAIERSVLLRMGFSSLEVAPIVKISVERELIGYGCGNLVYRLAKEKNISIREAGLSLAEGKYWDEVAEYFGVSSNV